MSAFTLSVVVTLDITSSAAVLKICAINAGIKFINHHKKEKEP